MAVYAIPSKRIVKVSASESKDFKERFNKHVMTPKQIEECKIAKELFSYVINR